MSLDCGCSRGCRESAARGYEGVASSLSVLVLAGVCNAMALLLLVHMVVARCSGEEGLRVATVARNARVVAIFNHRWQAFTHMADEGGMID